MLGSLGLCPGRSSMQDSCLDLPACNRTCQRSFADAGDAPPSASTDSYHVWRSPHADVTDVADSAAWKAAMPVQDGVGAGREVVDDDRRRRRLLMFRLGLDLLGAQRRERPWGGDS